MAKRKPKSQPRFDFRPIFQGLAISAVAMASISAFAWVLSHDYVQQRAVASHSVGPAALPAEEPEGDAPQTEAETEAETDELSQQTPAHGKLWGNCPKGLVRVLIDGRWICGIAESPPSK